jgi:PAS domain S-box-containing protein
LSPDAKTRPGAPDHRRRNFLVLLGVVIAVLFGILFTQAAFNLTFLRPSSAEQTFVFVALSGLTFVLFVAMTFVLARNLLKLYAERRAGLLGSKFRTRMVVGALILSSIPTIFLFIFAKGLMNRSIDKWFSQPVEEVRQSVATLTAATTTYATQNAHAEAASIASSPEVQRAFQEGSFGPVLDEFRRRELTLQNGFALAVVDDEAVASLRLPQPWGVLRGRLPRARDASGQWPIFELGGVEYALGSASVGDRGHIFVATPLPTGYTSSIAQLQASQQKYAELRRQRDLIRRTYMLVLLLITVGVLFAGTWLALFLSKLVTRPVEALAAATQEISRGRFDYRVELTAQDELGALIASFNHMAEELEASRRQIEASRAELSSANVQLEQRRRQIEAILESIPSGVLSLDAEGRMVHVNRAFQRIFNPQLPAEASAVAQGSALREVFPEEFARDLRHLMRKSDRMGMATSQMESTHRRVRLALAVTVASLREGSRQHGYVIVFDDLSDLLRAQKQMAWREVARRVAHEIKNPLTPIALSAERMRRHLERGAPDESAAAVLIGCVETIAGSVETVRTLVDEFSALARFPTAQPQSADINQIVESALAMFDGRLAGISVHTLLAPDLPRVLADPEAMKRALANLIDNAAEAMQDSLVREVQISTAVVGHGEAVEIAVSDTGHGVTAELKEKLFLPYFSTKKRGTGLGLAIVSRIVEDHHGSIRVEENSPVGARFIVEIPVAAEPALESAAHA